MSTTAENWHSFFMEITNRCNFDCAFCPSGISTRARHDLEPSLACELIDQLRALGFRGRIYFHVLGEPLLHPAVFEIIDHAAAVGLRPVLFTNGGALTDETVVRLLASHASELVISMQTINRASYERLRRTPYPWDTYLGRIQRALAVAHASPEGPPFRVSIGVKKPDAEHPGDLYFLEYESPAQLKEGIGAIFGQVQGIDLSPVYARLEAGATINVPTTRFSDKLSLSVKSMGNWRTLWRDVAATSGRCATFGGEMAVLSNGEVTYCHLDYDGRTAIGNVREKALGEIVAAPEYAKAARDFLAGGAIPRECAYCRGVKAA